MWFNLAEREDEESGEKFALFIEAGMEPDAWRRDCSLVEDYDDTFEAWPSTGRLIIQYKDKRYEDAIASFQVPLPR